MQVKPTVQTRFQIDLDWWEQQGRNFRVELWHHLCPGCRLSLATHRGTETIDWVDPETAEVHRVDGLWHSLRTCCAERPEFVASDTSLMTAVFRLFLANGNSPLSPLEIWQRLARRDPETILRLLVRGRSYYGIRATDADN
ncbi:MAG: hypothetical protein HPY83_04360 [Anaerolineae bacterium]|nr:hypothetical protein [Anaerolineae bacterium]